MAALNLHSFLACIFKQKSIAGMLLNKFIPIAAIWQEKVRRDEVSCNTVSCWVSFLDHTKLSY